MVEHIIDGADFESRIVNTIRASQYHYSDNRFLQLKSCYVDVS
jgi:hypothetical protein